MDALERLTADELGEPTLLAAHHLHRYHLAAALCDGLRVVDLGCGIGYGARILRNGGVTSVRGIDIDESAISEARERFGGDGVSFDVAPALEALRELAAGDVDAIVGFEVLEHLRDHDLVMARLAELAEQGVRLIVSVPNSRAFGELNEFHAIDFDFDGALATFERFDGVHMLYQHLAEGSVVVGAGERVTGRVEAQAHGEPEYANTFIAVVGFADVDVSGAVAELNLVVTPNHNRYMLGLQAGNEELRAANIRLGRGWIGRSDAAAAAALAAERRDAEAPLVARIAELEAELLRRVDELTAEVLEVGDDRAQLQRSLNAIARKRSVKLALRLESRFRRSRGG